MLDLLSFYSGFCYRYVDSCRQHGAPPNTEVLSALFKVCMIVSSCNHIHLPLVIK